MSDDTGRRDFPAETTATGATGEPRPKSPVDIARALAPAAVFVLLFAVCAYGVQWLGMNGYLAGYANLIARAAGWMLGIAGMPVTLRGPHIDFGSTGVIVGYQCSGLLVAVPIAAFLLVYPAPWKRRIVAAVVAIVAIQLVNIARVAVLAVISLRARDYLSLTHDTLWNAVVIAVTLTVWIAWSQRLERREA